MTKRRAKRKTNKRRSKKSKQPAGNTLTRSFSYPQGDGIHCNPIAYGGTPTVSVTSFKHSMVNVGASDASMFLKYYQYYRIKKVYLTFKAVSNPLLPVYQTLSAAAAVPSASLAGNCQVLLIPWRDGTAGPTWVGSTTYVRKLVEKYRQQRGVKYFLKPFESLKKGFTIKYTPNTLNVGFETAGGVTGLTYYNYNPNYMKWIANNDDATEHYGMVCIVIQAGQAPLVIQVKQSITVQYKGKCNDPLMTITPSSSDNSIRAANMEAVHLNGHSINHIAIDSGDFCCRATRGALANEDEDTPLEITIGDGNDPDGDGLNPDV
jgi:hypothetical protein